MRSVEFFISESAEKYCTFQNKEVKKEGDFEKCVEV